MLIIEADFNAVADDKVNLSRMRVHSDTPFAELAASGDQVLFVDYEEAAYGRLERDCASGDWFAVPYWSTQHEVAPRLGRPAYE